MIYKIGMILIKGCVSMCNDIIINKVVKWEGFNNLLIYK